MAAWSINFNFGKGLKLPYLYLWGFLLLLCARFLEARVIGEVVVINSYANIRTGPGTKYEKLGRVNKGERFQVMDTRPQWYEILYKGRGAWIYSGLVRFEESMPTQAEIGQMVEGVSRFNQRVDKVLEKINELNESVAQKITPQEGEIDRTEIEKNAVKIFLDVPGMYHSYIKMEIPFVNYVRDRKQAQVHVLLTTQRTASGGTEHTITLIGQGNFNNVSDTLVCITKEEDTEEIVRSKIVRVLKMGLVRYVAKTPLADNISISFDQKTNPAAAVDKWDYWVFNADIGTHVYGEESTKSFEVNGFFSADRVTPYLKVSLHIGANHEESHYKTEEDTIFSISKSRHFQGLLVKSLGEHWSAGIYGSTNSSTYSNIKFSANVSPAIEYNVFPYAESTRRQFRFLYRAGYTVFNYNEETIYDKFHEKLFNESLSATFEVKEKWGTVSSTLAGYNYFPDFNKNRLSFYSSLSLHLFEGLSLRIHGNLSMVHDQLSLSKVGATEEEILLHRKQVATQYDYFVLFGFRYTFGSIYSNVVNPRFESYEEDID